jgi:hypothetical protein
MIDNIELIKPILQFDSEDNFYYLQILQRKKENDETGSNSRIIKNYYVDSIKYLEDKYEEIKNLCNLFNARAYIRINRRSYEKVAYKAMVNLANTMSNREFISCSRSYDRAIGQNPNEPDKKWIVDCDFAFNDLIVSNIRAFIHNSRPYTSKYYGIIPSKNGFHLITAPFNLDDYNKLVIRKWSDIDLTNVKFEIHKDNPTNLYIP